MNTYFVIADLRSQNLSGDSHTGATQSVWSWSHRRWEIRNESKTDGRAYHSHAAAKRTAKKLGAHVSIRKQWGIHTCVIIGEPMMDAAEMQHRIALAKIDLNQSQRFAKFIAAKFGADTNELWSEFQNAKS